MRVIVATEPLSYREVIADTIRELRPAAEVISVEPEVLDEAIVRLQPQVVLCSHLTTTVVVRSPAWIVLYPDGQRLTVTGIDGRYTTATDLQLEQLLAVIDQAELSTAHPTPS